MRVHETRQYDATAQVDDPLGRVRLPDLQEGAAGNDDAVLDQQAGVGVDPQTAAGERVVRGVEERCLGRWSCLRLTLSRRGATLGRSGRRGMPLGGESLQEPGRDADGDDGRFLAGQIGQPDRSRDPIDRLRSSCRPRRACGGTGPTSPAIRSARSWRAARCGSRRRTARRPRRGRGSSPARGCPAATRRPRAPAATARDGRAPGPPRQRERASRGRGQLIRPRVDQMQLDVVPGQDPRELEPDMADPEDRHRRHHRQRLEQQLHLTAAALNTMLVRRFVRRARTSSTSGSQATPSAIIARQRSTATDSRFPPPTVDQTLSVANDHLGAGLPRRVPTDGHHRDQHARPALARAAAATACHPRHIESPPRAVRDPPAPHQTAPDASRGRRERSTLVPAGPNAAAACAQGLADREGRASAAAHQPPWSRRPRHPRGPSPAASTLKSSGISEKLGSL